MDEGSVRRRWLRGWRLSLLLVLLLLLVASIILVWTMRYRLAEDFIAGELERRGIDATYDVARIGFGRQVLENVVIGDPARPDLTADRVELVLAIGLDGPRIGFVKARGVRLVGRWEDGRVSFGQVDRLLPPPSGLPFRLPDQRIDLADAAILLETPSGRLAMGLAGRGRLSDGFRGGLVVAAPRFAMGACRLEEARGRFSVRVSDLSPLLQGPVALAAMDCGEGLRARQLLLAADATLSPAVDHVRGHSAVRIAALQSGPQRLANIEGRVDFDGDVERIEGQARLDASAAAFANVLADHLRLDGRYRLSPARGQLLVGGDFQVAGLTFERPAADIAGALEGAAGTPAGPVADALALALRRAATSGASARARLAVASGPGLGALRLTGLDLQSRSGARLLASGNRGIYYDWTTGRLRVEGDYALSGGGFPDARLSLRQSGSGVAGSARIAPMRVAGAQLALGEVEFAGGPGGTSFATRIAMDGPIGDGRVTGLTLPIRGSFGSRGLVVNPGCAPLGFRSIAIGTLRLGAGAVPLCPSGPALVWTGADGSVRAGARIESPRLAGRLGSSPIRIASRRIGFGSEGLSSEGLAIRIGSGSSAHALDIARLEGRIGGGGASGNYSGLSGQLAGVPLDVTDSAGSWRLDGGNLRLAGSIRIEDVRDPVRFHPVVSDDFALSWAGDRIEATGRLRHPASGTEIALARVEHILSTGAGSARLEVPGLTFTPDFQPEALTPLTVGVVALVDGTLSGEGLIQWDEAGTRSTGEFATSNANLAAPFGPVEGLTTSIRFTDLLGLVSAPSQVAEVDLVRAGVDVYDGRIMFQLQPDYRVAIERATWPYAGGTLLLQPTILDFSQPSTKYLTFRVDGLDAARFITQMEFSNIAATGTFDGLIPMQFDQSGGRIIGGRMSARAGGGTLSYIGELTDRDLGIYGKMAFDALKALRYDRFDMTLDGHLDGEFVTRIDLDGVAREPSGPIGTPGGAIGRLIARRVVSQLARIPFEFNIRIQGPFRALLATARSFEDPSLLIQPVLPRVLRDRPVTVTDVQDEESEVEP